MGNSRITISDDGDVVVRVDGDLDEGVVTRARQELAVAQAVAGRRRVVLDLTAVGTVDAAGRRLLADAARAFRGAGASFVVVHGEDQRVAA
jgi:anti-anti-sigma factor